MANDHCVSFRVNDDEFKLLKREAEARKVKVSVLLREAVFPSVQSDAFQTFKTEQQNANTQIASLLIELTKQTRFCSSVAANLYSATRPDAGEKLQKIHDGIFNEAVSANG